MLIRILPPDVAARIAAGEVVERPVSVVKELVENALDAGASRIVVEVKAGGLDYIRVTDDGCGIAPADLELAFARHATSKMDDSGDLSRVLTLGFRGEALPSVAAVAEVELVSRPPGAEAAAFLRLIPEASAEGGSRGAPVGTSISVRGLFARQPARRKFLRSPASETNAVSSAVSHYALAYPEVRFSLTLDGRQGLSTSGGGGLADAVTAVYGATMAGAMLAVSPGEGPIRVQGLAAAPDVSRASRGYVSLFVNRRWIQSRRLAYAVEEAYQGLLMVGRYPIAVLDVRLPYEEVDVNVHPTKAEVRFQDESAVFSALQRAVRRALLERSRVPSAWIAAGQPSLGPASQASTLPLWRRAAERRVASGEGDALDLGSSAGTPAQTLPVLRVIGQFDGTYIVAEGLDGMYLIDQHAAHERILYQQFREQRDGRAADVQGLLEPLTLEVPVRQRALLVEADEALREHGFEIEPFGEGAYLLRTLPRSLATDDIGQAVARFLDLMLEEGEGDQRDRVAMSLACHGAIRAGKTLVVEEMRELVRLLEESEEPNTCPHGRPTMIHMSADLLAREFGRR